MTGCFTSSRLTWIASRLVTRASYEGSSYLGSLVAHTPALPHHAQIRAQKSAQLSMVSTVFTLSMGTYWV